MLIESPNKIATIEKYIKNKGIKVMATVGHFREIDEKSFPPLGFDLKSFETTWKSIARSENIIDKINKAADNSSKIYLSTDPDREGEAISWHIYSILSEKNRKKCSRVVFNEITKRAIEEALLKPRNLDQNQINSYLARKFLDRGLGFKLSNFVNKSIGGISAGRVQSIALKFLRDKHEEIKRFVPEHWFNLKITLKNTLELTLRKVSPDIEVELHKELKNGLVNFLKEEDAGKVKASLLPEYTLLSIDDPKKEVQKAPRALKTSSMQKNAINKLGMSSNATERTAQKLYEGVNIDGESISLITYPRTDREDLSESFVKEANEFIINTYSKAYLGSSKSVKAPKKEELVQGAHEGIRPTDIKLTPESLENKLEPNEFKLYKLIWTYAVASLMKEATYENTTYRFENNKNQLTANFRKEIFEGFKVLFKKYFALTEDFSFPEDLKINNKYPVGNVEIKRVDKRPPAPHTEASLIDSLDEEGIGRPSTYSHIINIVLKREYAVLEKGKINITDFGLVVAALLEKHFPEIMKYDYTRNMEKELDNISENKTEWKLFLRKVFDSFFKEFAKASESITHEKVGRNCSQCNSDLVFKFAKKTGKKFISCSAFPKCKYVEFIEEKKELLEELCPECSAPLTKKISKLKKVFVGCSAFPKCKYVKSDRVPDEVLDRQCPQCNSVLVKKQSKYKTFFISCSGFPKCKYIEDLSLEGKKCPECQSDLVKKKGKKSYFISCSKYPKCKYSANMKDLKNE
ncbi:type I DNA topoisomerase [Candidatus Mycoplasma haematobovis]|nr:type I DNA topoisomerase [Candidatus Mycoplasma haematobovis]